MVDLTFIGNEGPLSADQSSVRGLSSVVPGKEPPFPHLTGPRDETRAWVPTIRDERKDFGQHTEPPSLRKCYKFCWCSWEQISSKELRVEFGSTKTNKNSNAQKANFVPATDSDVRRWQIEMRIVSSCHLLIYIILVRFSAKEIDFSLPANVKIGSGTHQAPSSVDTKGVKLTRCI